MVAIDENNIDHEAIREAGLILRQGGLVAFPTETVYGLGGDALNPDSSSKIYAAKGRPSDNPLIVHICERLSLNRIAANVPEVAVKLMDAFWPGPMTLVFDKKDIVPKETTGGLSTVAVRLPSNKIARELIRESGGFVAAPSANQSGRPSPTSCQYVVQDMDGRIDMIIDGKESVIGLESTIIDVTVTPPMILRPGYITAKMVEDTVGSVALDPAVFGESDKKPPRAPGMRYRHYAPRGDMTLVSGTHDRVVAYLREKLADDRLSGKRTGVLCSTQLAKHLDADSIKTYGDLGDEEAMAKVIYRALREFDDENTEVIYAEATTGEGLGQAIMNRLGKAAGNKLTVL